MQTETIDVTTIGELSDNEIDELLEHSINPRMPIEIFYAVLDRIGGIPAAAAPPAPLDPVAPVAPAPMPLDPAVSGTPAEDDLVLEAGYPA